MYLEDDGPGSEIIWNGVVIFVVIGVYEQCLRRGRSEVP